MRILFDHQIFSLQKYGGISRYFYHLLQEAEKMNVEIALPVYFSNNVYLKKLSKSKHQSFLPDTHLGIKHKIIDKKEQKNWAYIKNYLKSGKYDIFHPTYYNPYFLDYLGDKPFVLTIHDMIPERFPSLLAQEKEIIENKKRLALKANKIIAVSQATKKDIIKFYNLPSSSIHVIHHGSTFSELQIKHKTPKSMKLPDRYLLYVGNRYSYKNFFGLLEALIPVFTNDPKLKLLCAGGGKFRPEERDWVKEHGIKKNLLQKDIKDEKLIEIYNQALFLIFPSLYEGFGLPILEAFSTNCPVLVSNIAPFREIAQDAAVYFDPTDILDMREKIIFFLNNSTLRNELRQKAKKLVLRYRWKHALEKTMQVYEEVLNR